jgi:mono/diheme cytochrome c family protein
MKPVLLLTAALGGALLAGAAPVEVNYEKNCAGCHGADGRAQTRLGRKSRAKDLTDRNGTGRLSAEEIFATIKEGRKDPAGTERMEPFGERLSEPEIAALVTYVRRFTR